jgi:hypothetical protein
MRHRRKRERESGKATLAGQQRKGESDYNVGSKRRVESRERERRAGESGKMKINGGRRRG